MGRSTLCSALRLQLYEALLWCLWTFLGHSLGWSGHVDRCLNLAATLIIRDRFPYSCCAFPQFLEEEKMHPSTHKGPGGGGCVGLCPVGDSLPTLMKINDPQNCLVDSQLQPQVTPPPSAQYLPGHKGLSKASPSSQ